MKILHPTLEKTAIFSFFLIVLMFNFFQACAGNFALGIAKSCSSNLYLEYTVLFSAASYSAACLLVFACERGGRNGSGRGNKIRR